MRAWIVALAFLSAAACTSDAEEPIARSSPNEIPEQTVTAPPPPIDPSEIEHDVVTLDQAQMDAFYEEGRDLFDYDGSAPLDIRITKSPPIAPNDEFTRTDLTYASPKGGRVPATLLVPNGDGPFPAVVIQHGMPSTHLETFITARGYANSGVVTIAISAPWARRPNGLIDPVVFTARDRRDQIQLIVDLQRAVDLLIARDDVDPNRIGYRGVSYGGAMGGLFAGIEKRLQAYLLVVGDGGLLEHFTGPEEGALPEQLGAKRFERWLALMEPIESLYYVGHAAPARLFFQNGLDDIAVPAPDALRYQMAGSDPKEVRWYRSGHALPYEADCEGALWLAEQLDYTDRHPGCA